MTNESNIILPSSPADQLKLKQMLTEAVNCHTRIDAEKDAIKEIIEDISETFQLPKKIVSKIVNAEHKGNFDALQEENENFVQLYELIANR